MVLYGMVPYACPVLYDTIRYHVELPDQAHWSLTTGSTRRPKSGHQRDRNTIVQVVKKQQCNTIQRFVIWLHLIVFSRSCRRQHAADSYSLIFTQQRQNKHALEA